MAGGGVSAVAEIETETQRNMKRIVIRRHPLAAAGAKLAAVMLAVQLHSTTNVAAARLSAEARSLSPFSTEPEQIKPPNVALPSIGRLAVRHAREIASSTWSIGGETLDRDFAVYENYKAHVGPLGAKGIRLQAGWAKCEKAPGTYDWAWLDAIVNDALAQGVQPWLETSYGNTLYAGGGGTGLGGGFPKSSEALAAWDNWVRALVRHFKDRVREWEVWNEPDLSKANTSEEYTALFIRTARAIRAEQPGARIYALALAHRLPFAEEFLRRLHEARQANLMDAVTFHGYPHNPDNTSEADALRALLKQYAPHAHVRQGETGAPSKWQANYALSIKPWSENTQAKWDLRRMLAHHAKEVPMSLFTIMDMHYLRDGRVDMNWKGVLAANPDKTVAHRKPSYLAAQRVFSIFDDTLERDRDVTLTSPTTEKLAAAAWRHRQSGGVVAAVWQNGAPPRDANDTTPTDLNFAGVTFAEPVLADLLTGAVFAIPADRWPAGPNGTTFKKLPLYDSPVLIAEKSALRMQNK